MFIQRTPELVSRWYLAFHLKRNDWWGERLIPGRFSHVSAFSYLDGPKVWVLVDHTPRRTGTVGIWPSDHHIPSELGVWVANCSILRADVRQREGFRPRFGFWCVTAVKDLLGSESGALSPEGLWNDLVRAGAQIVHDAFTAPTQAGPDGGSPDRERSEGARASGPV